MKTRSNRDGWKITTKAAIKIRGATEYPRTERWKYIEFCLRKTRPERWAKTVAPHHMTYIQGISCNRANQRTITYNETYEVNGYNQIEIKVLTIRQGPQNSYCARVSIKGWRAITEEPVHFEARTSHGNKNIHRVQFIIILPSISSSCNKDKWFGIESTSSTSYIQCGRSNDSARRRWGDVLAIYNYTTIIPKNSMSTYRHDSAKHWEYTIVTCTYDVCTIYWLHNTTNYKQQRMNQGKSRQTSIRHPGGEKRKCHKPKTTHTTTVTYHL